MDLTAIGFDALKVMGGIGTAAIAYFTVQGMTPKKPNGHAKCNEHTELMTLSKENNVLLKEISTDNKEHREVAREERKELFRKVDVLEEKVATIRARPKKVAKQLKPFQCLVIDDMQDAADAAGLLLESYLKGIISCTPVMSVEEARQKLNDQEFDFVLIDYFLNASENGYEVYKYFKKAYPKMKCLIYSGQKPDAINPEIKDIYIEKPFNRDQIIEKITQLMED